MQQSPALYVLLYHTLSDSVHWDLCLDVGDALATWRILDDPAALAGAGHTPVLRAERLPDHRRLYLDHEGPVSGNRGHVARVDRGRWEPLDRSPDRWTFRLAGRLLVGTFALTRQPDDPAVWTLQRLAV